MFLDPENPAGGPLCCVRTSQEPYATRWNRGPIWPTNVCTSRPRIGPIWSAVCRTATHPQHGLDKSRQLQARKKCRRATRPSPAADAHKVGDSPLTLTGLHRTPSTKLISRMRKNEFSILDVCQKHLFTRKSHLTDEIAKTRNLSHNETNVPHFSGISKGNTRTTVDGMI